MPPAITEEGPVPVGAPRKPVTELYTLQSDWRELSAMSQIKSDALRARFLSLLERQRNMWSVFLGTVKGTEPNIELVANKVPIRQQRSRAGENPRELLRKEIATKLLARVIELTQTEWASPVLLVLKKDGTTRFCVDLGHLNAATLLDTHPLPPMQDMN